MYNIIPLAGPDLTNDNNQFRPLYKIDNQELIVKALTSRNWYHKNSEFIFILREVEKINYLKTFLSKYFQNSKFITLSQLTRGALLSSLSALSLIEDYNRAICIDLADIIYDCNLDPLKSFKEDKSLYGIIPSFESNESQFSYLKIEKNCVVETKEKKKISNTASAGTYFFKNVSSLLDAISWSLQNEKLISFKDNLFICPCYNFFTSKNKKVINFMVSNVIPISNIFKK